MVNIEMHMFKHEPFLFVGGGGGKDYYGKNLYFMVRILHNSHHTREHTTYLFCTLHLLCLNMYGVQLS